jgi:hypothetical protein
MGQPKRLTAERLRTILSRQDPPQFGRNYVASILATREEAPRESRFAEVWCPILDRCINTISAPERQASHLILHCPLLFELQEQRMLPFSPAEHPLHGHPLSAGLNLPHFRGTLEVADELGVLEHHPTVPTKTEDGIEMVPFPWIGDFLLFLLDDKGPYCINVSIKATREAFEIPDVGIKPNTDMTHAIAHHKARQSVEKALYEDIGISTIQIAMDEVNPIVLANLEQIHGWSKRIHGIDDVTKKELLNIFRIGMQKGMSALEVIGLIKLERDYSTYQLTTLMYQAIWNRELRIDLFQYFFREQPMVPERKDIMNVYGHWFRRP